MKKIVLVITVLLMSVSLSAQKKKKNAKVSFDVDGVCMMCKSRIEKAALNSKGVKYALWNVKTHQLNLIIDKRKTDVSTIQQNVANVGHDTDVFKAPKEIYENLHGCCKYRDEEVQEDHKIEKK
jgi:cation transport ATPase